MGKEISNRGKDYKSGQDRLQTGAGITNRCRTFFTVQEKFYTSVETSLFSNTLKACVNEIDNTQEKDKKSWRGI